MKINKLLTDLEEEIPSFTFGFAIIIPRKDVKKFIEITKECYIPKYLKRVKIISPDWVYLLTNKIYKNFETIKIKLPHKQAHTQEQYLIYKEIWPCIFYKKKEDPLNFDFIKRWVNEFKNTNTNFCFIVDGYKLLSRTFCKDDILGHAIFQGIDIVSRSKIGYLCTGFDAFILNEPCLSCAMAFVHGRIRRVFCLTRSDGSFSKMKFNYNKDTNHRYEVYFIDEWR